MFWLTVIAIIVITALFFWFFSPVLAAALVLFAASAMLYANTWTRRKAQAESERRIGQPRRRQFRPIAQERRSGLPRRDRDNPRDGLGFVVTEEIVVAAEPQVRRAGGKNGDAGPVPMDGVVAHPQGHESKAIAMAMNRQRDGEAVSRHPSAHMHEPGTDAAASNGGAHALGETTQITGPRPEDGSMLALAIAKANLALEDTERTLKILHAELARRTGHPGTKTSNVTAGAMQAKEVTAVDVNEDVVIRQAVPARADDEAADRRKWTRRNRANRRSAMRWDPQEYHRRERWDRRDENLVWKRPAF
jgi:hypothetical protein